MARDIIVVCVGDEKKEKKDSQVQILSTKISSNSDSVSRVRWEPQRSFCSVLAPLLLLRHRQHHAWRRDDEAVNLAPFIYSAQSSDKYTAIE